MTSSDPESGSRHQPFGMGASVWLIALASSGCTGDSRAGQLDLGVWRAAAPHPLVTIGVADGAPEYQFFAITAGARQRDGDLVIVDGGAREIRLFRGDGTFVRAFGGPGDGPGTFREPTDILITHADSILIWDDTHYRVTAFDSAGAFAGVWSIDRGALAEAATPPLYPGPARFGSRHTMLIRLLEKTKAPPRGAFRRSGGALRVAFDLSTIDTIAFFDDVEQVPVTAPWGAWSIEPPLARRAYVVTEPHLGRVCVAKGERPSVECVDADGMRTVIEVAYDGTPVTADELTRWRDTTVALFGAKMTAEAAGRMLGDVPVPGVRPPVSDLVLDRAGRLWVAVGPVRDEDDRAQVLYVVFDPNGTELGEVRLPRLDVLEIGEDYVLGVSPDDHEVEYVHLYLLRRGEIES